MDYNDYPDPGPTKTEQGWIDLANRYKRERDEARQRADDMEAQLRSALDHAAECPAAGPEDSRSRGAATRKDADPRPDGARNTSDQGVLSPLDHLSAPPPVPAPVDVEAVVRRFHHLPCKLCRPGPGQLCARALDIRAAVQFVLSRYLELFGV